MELTATHAREKLLRLLQSNTIPLRDATEICQRRELWREYAYCLQHGGKVKEAIKLMISKLGLIEEVGLGGCGEGVGWERFAGAFGCTGVCVRFFKRSFFTSLIPLPPPPFPHQAIELVTQENDDSLWDELINQCFDSNDNEHIKKLLATAGTHIDPARIIQVGLATGLPPAFAPCAWPLSGFLFPR